ncbi:uncharacterized protein DUF2760 [Desulfobotulus alkaliphilus]|uniref:Uncharacterized protein DUF2760 n=1 Tax=Desulfobotulus alkaliphilus TaxID=622671 RepID=A0A562RNS3_9BACT|nr:DUF2760 domain-containing protein [Desulfobotulus alkaliphilus]TWI70718.1 uncharacterized protein DUF2760 [Desulfobotulus alkaliphilus]
MNPSLVVSRRIFWLALLFFIPVFTLAGWLAAYVSPEAEILPSSMDTFRPLLPHAGALAGLFSAIVFRAVCSLLLKKQQQGIVPPPAAKEMKPATRPKPEEDPAARKAREERMFLYLLSVLQKEGRLLDFFAEDLDLYEDDQIGAAVRPVHESARKILSRYMDLGVVMEEEEGSRITVPKGFDPSRIKLVGKVAGDPPFQGILRHRGWQARGVRMPSFSDAGGADILTPSEVEIL